MCQLKENVFERKTPKLVKRHEKYRINLAYTNITKDFQENNIKFNLIEGLTYLWVYTENKEIVVGIEEPWKYPQAFIDVNNSSQVKLFNKIIKPQLKKSGMLGHPTIASSFADKGEAVPEHGKAFIGGEIKFINQQWCLDNHSGRFGWIKNNPEEIQLLMRHISEKFREATGKKPTFSISIPQAKYFKAYCKMWQSGKNEVDNAVKLLQDYIKSSSKFKLFLTGHWNRKNLNLVKKSLLEFSSNPNLTIQDISNYFQKNLDLNKTNLNGSLMRRLKFILGQAKHNFDSEKLCFKL